MEKRYRNLWMEIGMTLKVWNHRLFYILRRNGEATKVLFFILFVKFQCCLSQVSLEYFIQIKVNSALLHQTMISLKTVSVLPYEEYITNRAKLLIIHCMTPDKTPIFDQKKKRITALSSWDLLKNRKKHFLSSCAVSCDPECFLVPI